MIDNQSAHDVSITIHEGATTSNKSFAAGSAAELLFKSGATGLRDKGEGFLIYNAVDSLVFEPVQGGFTVVKSPNARANWEYTTNPKRKDEIGKPGDNIYTFILTDADVQ